MGTKFTPGPWYYNGYSAIFYKAHNPDDDDIICTINDWRESGHGDQLRGPRAQEAAANGHLIAAAPEMLEALEQAEISLTAVAVHGVQDMMRADAKEVLGYIRKAIAKATGES